MRPTIETFTPRLIGPKPWGEELLIASTPLYTMKRLTMRAGTQGGLQFHAVKDETFYLVSGEAIVRFDAGKGLESRSLQVGESIHVPPGAVHQVQAVTDCVFFEASNPVFDDRVNVGFEYHVTDGEAS